MPNWKKVIISGSNISQLTNDSGYVLADQVSGSSTALSASLTTTDQAISASVAALSGSASDARNLLESISASYALTSSYSHTASYALNGGGSSGFPAEYVTANTTAEKDKTYVFETSTAYTLTLPLTPTNGDSIQISNRSNIGTNVLGRNGELIMGGASDLTLDLATASFILTYAGGTQGWVIIGAGGGATTGSAASVWYDGETFLSSSVDVRITGSLSVSGNIEGNIESSSYALTSSYAISSSHEVTHEVSSSYAQTATSASYALTASYALNGGGSDSDWYDGGTFITSSRDVRITGSLDTNGDVNFGTLQVVLPIISQSGNFADDTAAASGGIALGGLYRNGNLIVIRLS